MDHWWSRVHGPGTRSSEVDRTAAVTGSARLKAGRPATAMAQPRVARNNRAEAAQKRVKAAVLAR